MKITKIIVRCMLCASTWWPLAHSQDYPPIPVQKTAHKIIIPICTSLPLFGDCSIIGRQILSGIENYLREYKHFTIDTGEEEGQRIIIKHLVNNKDIDVAGQQALTDALNQTPLLLGLVSTSMGLSLIPQLKQKKVCALFPIDGDQTLRKQHLDNVIYFRPSHEQELRALLHYAITIKHKFPVAILYEASPWGLNVLESAKKILQANNVSIVKTASYVQGTVEIEQALTQISHSAPSAILCLAKPRPAYHFISNALNTGLNECLFLGLSELNVIQKLLKTSRGLDIAVTSVVPSIDDTSLPIVREYKKAMQNFLTAHDDSPFYLEAFIMLSLLEYGVQTISGPITIPSLIKSFESLRDVNFKGLRLTFNATDRSLSSALWINPGLQQPWISFNPQAD